MRSAMRLATSKDKEAAAKVIAALVAVPWSAGKAHLRLERSSASYRTLGVQSLARRDAVDRVFQALDLVASISGSDPDSLPGAGKYLAGVTIPPGLRVSNVRWRLHGANFEEATLHRTKFNGVGLNLTLWRQTSLLDCTFRSCNFWRAVFSPRIARGTVFDECKFDKVRMSENMDATAFVRCSLREGRLQKVSFSNSRFHDCSLRDADLTGSDLKGVRFERCDLRNAILRQAQLQGATFANCDLRGATFSDADITGLNIGQCKIYGISLWGATGEVASAQSLSLARDEGFDAIEIDGLHIANFVSSLLEGNGARDLVDGLSSSMVLVLGRFARPHKEVLDGIRVRLRELGYSAVVFDSSPPANRDASETISILARLSRFVIADLTEPRSAPYELGQFIADCRTPVQVVSRGEGPFSMFSDLEKYPWVMPGKCFPEGEALLSEVPALAAGLEDRRSALEDQERTAA